jgi:hypothetical protein
VNVLATRAPRLAPTLELPFSAAGESLILDLNHGHLYPFQLPSSSGSAHLT